MTKFLKGLVILALLLPGQTTFSQKIKIIHLEELNNILSAQSDSTFVLNFWASWCGPCLKELPIFDVVSAKYPNQNVKVLLVSVDGVEDLDKKVRPLIKKKEIKSSVLLLDESNENQWIAMVDKKWSGSIPFTIIFNNATHKKVILEKALSLSELEFEMLKVL